MTLVALILALLGTLACAAAALGVDSRVGWLGGALVGLAVLALVAPGVR